jgi:hypothetical protein
MELVAVLGVLFISLLLFGAVLAVVGLVLKCVLWIVLLPIRLVFYILLLPLLLLKFAIGGVLVLAFGPILAVGAVLGLIAFVAALIVPLLPLLIVAGLVWLVVRASRPAVA